MLAARAYSETFQVNGGVDNFCKSPCKFRPATFADADEVVASYESVFGKGGMRSANHEAYPAPEVFTADGVRAVISDVNRNLIVAEIDREIAGAMIITHNSRYHREFGCVSVRKTFQGCGISSLMLGHVKKFEEACSLAINTTEIVTHSVLSQTAHHRAGYKHVTGFGFCQYPKVFFVDHPESCLWVTTLEGCVFDSLRHSKPSQGAYRRKSPTALTSEEVELAESLQSLRSVYVPTVYVEVVKRILAQFDNIMNYRVFCQDYGAGVGGGGEAVPLRVDLCGDASYAYVTFPACVLAQPDEQFAQMLESVVISGKRYVQARVPVNSPAAVAHISQLRQHGFVFLGIAPLFGYEGTGTSFEDVFLMQWVAREVLASCALPGETDSVVKLYGYPTGVAGDIVSTMKRDWREFGVGAR